MTRWITVWAKGEVLPRLDSSGNVTRERRFNGTQLNYTYDDNNFMVQAGSTEYAYNAH